MPSDADHEDLAALGRITLATRAPFARSCGGQREAARTARATYHEGDEGSFCLELRRPARDRANSEGNYDEGDEGSFG